MKMFRAGPELGCKLEFIDLAVMDSKTGRQIETGDPHIGSGSALLTDIVHLRLPVTFTGVKRWPHSDGCAASAVWAAKE